MTQATDGATTVNYTFDAFGNRITHNDGSYQEEFILDGWDTTKPGRLATKTSTLWRT
jgi:hypothetical protein